MKNEELPKPVPVPVTVEKTIEETDAELESARATQEILGELTVRSAEELSSSDLEFIRKHDPDFNPMTKEQAEDYRQREAEEYKALQATEQQQAKIEELERILRNARPPKVTKAQILQNNAEEDAKRAYFVNKNSVFSKMKKLGLLIEDEPQAVTPTPSPVQPKPKPKHQPVQQPVQQPKYQPLTMRM